jgi:predicted DNA-binding antitoxin AbrB/MazE fold protein
MQEVIHAVYRNGAFVPVVPCSLPEETEVEVRVRNGADIIPPLEPDSEKRAKIRREVVERMHNNPIPANAPRFTRDELHERR